MPRVIPGGGPDTTSQFLLQITHGNQALARLYAQMLAKYEDRLEQQAFQREMQGVRSSEADRRTSAANAEWYNRRQFDSDLRNPPGTPAGPNYLGPGAGGTPNPMSPKPAAAPATTAAAPAERPSVYTLDKNPYSGSGAGTSAPVAPAPQATNTTGAAVSPKVAALLSSGAADANASGAGHTEFSAQSRRPLPTVEEPPRTPRREVAPNTQLPPQPRVTPKTAATRPQALFLDVDQRWLDLMHQMEDKYNLPRGAMMTVYGIENGGGRQFGRNKNSTAEGIFQFTKELRDEHKLSDKDIYDPAKMIPAAAMNMRRNADILERNHKIKLPTTPETIPMFVALHQWGSGAGPRAVAAYLQNPDAPMASSNIMGTQKDANGNVLSNYTILSSNGHKPNITVKEALQNKAVPWYSGYTQQFRDHAHQPVGQYKSTAAPVSDTPQVGDPNAPRPPGSIPPDTGTMGANPRLVAAVRGGATYLPEGYTIRQTSGHRPHGDPASHHYRRNAGDFQIYTPDGKPIPNRGGDTTGLYTLLARGVKTWVTNNDPQLLPHIGYGGAFGTQLRGGGVPDLMHYDLGGAHRGNMVPSVRFNRLQPIGDAERTQIAQRYGTQVAAAPQQPQPVKVAGPLPPREEPTRPYVTSAISRIPTSGEVGATFAARDKAPAAVAATATPPLDIPPIPIKPQASGVEARSDPYYNLQNDIGEGIPTLQTRNVPMPPERPITESGDLGGTGTPADAPLPGLDEQLDIQTNAPQVPLPPLKPPEPEFTPAERIPMSGAPGELTSPSEYGAYGTTPPDSVQDAMADAFRQRTEPGYQSADFNVIPRTTDVATLPPPPGATAKEPLPDEFTSVTPRQATPDPQLSITPQLDVPTTIARAPLPPGFKVPLPTLGGDNASAAANAPANQMPRDLQQPLPARLPEPLPRPVSSGNAPTIRSIVDAIYSGNIPNLATSTDPSARNVYTPPPVIPEQQLAETLSIPRDKLEAVGEWLKQNFGPSGQPDNQKVFNEAMQQYVRSGVGAVVDWWNKPPTAKPTTQSGPPAPPVAAQQPVRTMPDGRPYFPDPEPLVVPPRPGAAGPTNNTLSKGPQGATPIPAPPGTINPMTGRIDVPAPDILQDGTKKFYEPGEVPNQAGE